MTVGEFDNHAAEGWPITGRVRKTCGRYVKGMFDGEPGNPRQRAAVQLSFEDSMAFQPLCDGLGVTYLVDAGDHFEYVQYQDCVHRV